MPLTPKQEAFARAFVETNNASEAYRRAYNAERMKDKTVNEAASRVAADSKVAARVREIRELAAERHDITLDRLTEMALRAYKVGESRKSADGMVSAVKQLSRMHGLDVEKRPNERSAFADLPADVRRALGASIAVITRASGDDREGAAVH